MASVPPVPKVGLPPGQLVLPELGATEAFLDRLRGYAGDRSGQLEIGTGAAVIVTDDADGTAKLAAIHTYLTRADPVLAQDPHRNGRGDRRPGTRSR